MTEYDDPMIAFEQTRAADLAEFYRGLALLSEATTLIDLREQEKPLRMRLEELSTGLISKPERQALKHQLKAMLHSCAYALGEGAEAYPAPAAEADSTPKAEYFRLSDRISGCRVHADDREDDSTSLSLEGETIPRLVTLDGCDWTNEQLSRIAASVIEVREEWQLRGHQEGRREKLKELRAALELG